MRALIRRAAVAAGATAALLGPAVWAAGPAGADTNPACPDAFSSTATSCTYHSTGAEQTFTVPSGVTAVTIAAVGAPGGTSAGANGFGASVTATVSLPPHTATLYVEVGGDGQPNLSSGGATPCLPPAAAGGFNGGGDGGPACGGGGGGASDVRTTSISQVSDAQLTTGNDSRLVVAGGGGGGGSACNGGTAGDATVTGAGAGGGCTNGAPANGGNGGFGGTQGGNGGNDGGYNGTAAVPGSPGLLGQGGTASSSTNQFGGGGGGGYYGGGGGDIGGGGAGSSFWVPGATNTSMTEDTTGTPQVVISWTPPAVAPAVTGVSPASGPLAGGTTVTITGTGFTGATAVGFGTVPVPASSFTVNGDGSITATAPAAASVGAVDVTVTTPAGTSATSAADQYSYTYAFTGLLAPVASPPALNQVHAGQAVPVQFSLGAGFGLGILAAGSPAVTQVNCSTGAPVNTGTMTDTAGGSGLQYDSTTGNYTYVWKTSKAWAGSCQKFTITLNDGTSHTAIFQFG